MNYPTYEEIQKALETLSKVCSNHAMCDWCDFYDEEGTASGQTNCKLMNCDEPAQFSMVDEW